MLLRRLCLVLPIALCAACQTAPARSTPAATTPTAAPPVHDEIVICGQRIHTGAPVVLWFEPPHYDATKSVPRFSAPSDDQKKPQGLRYQPGRVRKQPNPDYAEPPPAGEHDARTRAQRERDALEVLVPPNSRDRARLAEVVDQFVLHFDVCGVSRTCFRVLQDERGLSVHFLLDLDGTIYQTMDLADTGWHATKSNGRSIGVEIANMGAYAPGAPSPLDAWYARDAAGPYVKIPERLGDGGLRTPGFVARPARAERVRGTIQGEALEQFDFTPEQYASLAKLAAALCTAFPNIAPDAPRARDGSVVDRALSDDAWRAFRGILGHYHVQTNKNDPGPAFDWERFLAAVRTQLSSMRAAP